MHKLSMRMALPMPTVNESIVLFWYWTVGVVEVVEGISDEVLEVGAEYEHVQFDDLQRTHWNSASISNLWAMASGAMAVVGMENWNNQKMVEQCQRNFPSWNDRAENDVPIVIVDDNINNDIHQARWPLHDRRHVIEARDHSRIRPEHCDKNFWSLVDQKSRDTLLDWPRCIRARQCSHISVRSVKNGQIQWRALMGYCNGESVDGDKYCKYPDLTKFAIICMRTRLIDLSSAVNPEYNWNDVTKIRERDRDTDQIIVMSMQQWITENIRYMISSQRSDDAIRWSIVVVPGSSRMGKNEAMSTLPYN